MSKRHERLLFRYSAALERGDFEAVTAVLREAEHDPALEARLLQLNDAYAAEQSARFDHSNPKEYPMIAALYQNHKSTPARATRRVYSLSFVVALAVVALVGVILATRLADSTIWNSAQQGSPEAPLLQVVPADCALNGNETPVVELYSRPSPDALVIHQYFGIYIPQTALTLLDAAEAEGQTWYYVSISDRGTEVRGWVTAEAYTRNVGCASAVAEGLVVMATPVPFQPTVVPPNQVALPTFTPSPYNEESLWLTGEAISLSPTVVPPNQQALSTITATPVPFQSEATAFPPTVVPPNEVALSTFTPVPLDPATPTLSPMVVPAAASDLPDFPVYFVREGDTLLSILQMFNFDESMLDDLRIYNRLSADAVLTPGQALVIPVNMPDLVTTCVVKPEQTLPVLLEPSSVASRSWALPAGTSMDITGERQQDDGLWVSVRAQMQGVTISGVWVRTDTLDFVTDCRTDFAATSEPAVVETPTPVPTATPVFSARSYRPSDYPVYTVQSGDTLLSILARFQLDANMLPELLFINNLPENATELPATLLIPVAGAQMLTCVVNPAEMVELRVQPQQDAEVIATLPQGAPFRVLDQWAWEGDIWYMIMAQLNGTTITSVWVNTEAISLLADCQRFPSSPEALPTVPPPTLIPTAAPVVDPLAVASIPVDEHSCSTETDHITNIQDAPGRGAKVIEQLPAGTPIAVLGISYQPDGAWYMVIYPSPVEGTLWGMVDVNLLDLPDACSYYGQDGSLHVPEVTLYPTVPPLATATPLPSMTTTPAQ